MKAELGRRRNGERQGEREGGRNNCSKSIKLQGSAPAVAAVFCVMFARANRTMRASIDSQREVEKREWGRGGAAVMAVNIHKLKSHLVAEYANEPR